jgi:ATP-dependent DNA helicase DinG
VTESHFSDSLADPDSVDVIQLTRDFFGPDTPLKRAEEFGGRPYEERSQQREMAERIASDLLEGKHLSVEAPTGVGKSFAYLIPAIFLAKKTDKPIVISTHTIALQEQLLYKDVPLIGKMLGIEVKAAIAKGRQNYLCMHRLNACANETLDFLPDLDMMPEVGKIAKWAETTQEGSLSDLPFKPNSQLWSTICSEVGVCPRDINKHKGCFFQKARRKWFTADVLIANHAMFCVDLAARRKAAAVGADEKEAGILPDYCAAIVDEAHTFEEVAATHMGLRFSTIGLYMTLNRLLHPKTQRGLLTTAGPQLQETVNRTHDLSSSFFKRMLAWLEDQHENPLAYEHAGHVPNLLDEPLTDLVQGVEEFVKDCDPEDDIVNELDASLMRLAEYRDTLDAFLKMDVPDSVYWFERFGREGTHISLNAVPIEVNDLLRDVMFNNEFSVVMTSATMAVENRLDYFKRRLGCEMADELILGSPFDFKSQVDLFLPDGCMPDPRDTDDYIAACCTQIKHFVSRSDGRAFVLFTNYSAMNTVADLIGDFFEDRGYRLLVQGRKYQRRQMLDIFKEDIRSVLFGTASFWMGVDVPGEALSNVIITRLPFPVPSHPLIEAICRRIDERGGNAFREFSVPEAILKLRQGCGRLIRSQDDRGIIVILDPRIRTKFYGRYFINSLPPCTVKDF